MSEIRKDKRWKRRIKLGIYLSVFIIGIVLLFLPADFFDEGQSVCLSVMIFDRECYACGMTRAVQHLLHFNFEQAYYFNKLSFIVLPLAIYLVVTDFYKFLKRKE